MTRCVAVCVLILGFGAPAPAQDKVEIGKVKRITFAKTDPKGVKGWYHIIYVDKKPGDLFTIEVAPVDEKQSTKTLVRLVAEKDINPNGKANNWRRLSQSAAAVKSSVTMTDSPGGKVLAVLVFAEDFGDFNLLIKRVGDEPPPDPKDAEIKKLRDENAVLRKELAEMKSQLADIKKLLESKKP